MKDAHISSHQKTNNPTKKLWFKRKTYGWGWTPSSWQGWLAVAIYLFILLMFVTLLDPNTSDKDLFVTFIAPLTIVTLIFIEIAYRKGEKPRWQWGNKTKDRN